MRDSELYEQLDKLDAKAGMSSDDGQVAIAKGLVAIAYGLIIAGRTIARAIAHKQVEQTGEYE